MLFVPKSASLRPTSILLIPVSQEVGPTNPVTMVLETIPHLTVTRVPAVQAAYDHLKFNHYEATALLFGPKWSLKVAQRIRAASPCSTAQIYITPDGLDRHAKELGPLTKTRSHTSLALTTGLPKWEDQLIRFVLAHLEKEFSTPPKLYIPLSIPH